MTKEDLKALGLTEQDVLDRLVERLCSQYADDESGYRSDFESRIEKAIKKRVDEVIEKTMSEHVLPNVTQMIEGICLQETNKWGESIGKKLTFIEYLVARVDAYIREEVNYNGKSRSETDSYSWSAKSTRITHMIHEYLQHSVSQAMLNALGTVNSSVRKGLQDAVEIALKNIEVRVNTEVKTK